jgi:hypothetical protein
MKPPGVRRCGETSQRVRQIVAGAGLFALQIPYDSVVEDIVRHAWLPVILVIALALSTGVARADLPVTPANAWVTNRPVQAVTRVGNRLFIGGNFTSVFPTSRYTGSVAAFAHGDIRQLVLPPVSGESARVLAVVDDGAGGWFVGGQFARAGDVAMDPAGPDLAHVHQDGTVQALQIPAPPGTAVAHVRALARSGETLMVAYQALSFSGRIVLTADYLVPFDVTTGQRRASDIRVLGNVQAMAADDARVYVFGGFSEIGGVSRFSAAAFDAVTLGLTDWAPQIPADINAVAIDGATAYLAGGFSMVAGQPRQNLAALSTTDGTVLPWAPSVSCRVAALAAGPDAVYLGGCEGANSGLLTSVDRINGAPLGWSATVDGAVGALDVIDSRLYVGGGFTSVAGAPRLNAASFTNGAIDAWNPRPSDVISAIAATAEQVAIAGALTGLDPVARPGLAEFDATTGALLPWVPAGLTPRSVASLHSDERYLFVRSGTLPCDGLFGSCEVLALPLDGSDPVPVPNGALADAVAAARDRLYLSGAFGLLGYDTRTSTALPWRLPYRARKILATDSVLYAVMYDVEPADQVWKIDARTGQVLPWGPVTTTLPIAEMALADPWLLIGLANPTSAAGSVLIAADQLSGTIVIEAPNSLVPFLDFSPYPSWSALINPPPWFPRWAGLAVSPRGILVASNGTLLAISPVTGNRLAWSLSLDGPAPTLYADERIVVLGGSFAKAGGVLSPGVAIFPERVPAAPADLVATVFGSEVRLAWTRPSDGDPIDYRLEAGSAPGATDLATLPVPPTTSFAVGGVPEGRYFVRLRAATAAGVGPPSNEVEVIIGTPPPRAPEGFTATVDNQTISISWSAVSGRVDRYVLDVGSGPGLSNLLRDLSLGLATSARFENVPAGAYFARVRAINGAGSSPPSTEATIVVPSATAQRTR